MCRLTRPRAAALALYGTFVVAASVSAAADTTVPVTGIGTSVTAGDFAIETRVDRVTYSAPRDDVIRGMPVTEVRGTVSGVGWGGTGNGLVPRGENASYRYDLPFVARWRRDGRCDRLVFYNHGGGPNLLVAVRREKADGTANPSRSAELNGDLLAGVPALLDRATYVSVNRRGLRGDGTFSATYLPEGVPPLTAAEVGQIGTTLGGFAQPGIAAGAPVPALPTNDAATFRDVARALERVLAGLQGRPFRTRIGVGTSSGARLLGALDFGLSVIGNEGVRSGGNHTAPYDAASPRIFDGFVLNGFGYTPGAAHADPAFPLSGPTMFVQGLGDERYQQHVAMAKELLDRGVVLDGSVWLYEVKNLTHVTRDVPAETADGPDGDRLGCFLSAAIRNLRTRIEYGSPPPLSRMGGRLVGGTLRFGQAGGSTTDVAPVLDDPTLDSVVTDGNLKLLTIGKAETDRWTAVAAALPHVGDSISPPAVACRVGGYRLMFFGARLLPFTPADLQARYGGFDCYRAGVCRVVARLEAERLYDPRVESAAETAERGRPLFAAGRSPP